MKIVKEYDLNKLAKIVKGGIETRYKLITEFVNLDVLVAQEIVEVLERMAELEVTHMNEFECYNNIEKTIEEENNDFNTVRKQMELHSKIDRNGNILRGVMEETLNQIKTKEKECGAEELQDNRKCFGACVEDDYICTHCSDYEKCLEETNRELEEEDDML